MVCEADALAMATIARSRGFRASVLLTKAAVRKAVLGHLKKAVRALQAGDIYCMTFAGHGGQIPDRNGDEEDNRDETWCLYDAQLIDDELWAMWAQFRKGVRVLIVADCCHSGTIARVAPLMRPEFVGRVRFAPSPVIMMTYRAHKRFYDGLQKDLPPVEKTMKAGRGDPSLLGLTGCQDNQLASEGQDNGLFTGELVRVWNDGKFAGSYLKMIAAIKPGMPATQSPNLFSAGTRSNTFARQSPFSI